ncbi:MAG: hypothetical protein GEU99_01370 [Luteitalea sp.]|nr:hypothetical protein [Luteitalea sp.]
MTGNARTIRAWFGVFVVLVFGAGVATGLLLHRYLEPPLAADGPAPLAEGAAPMRLMALMADELDLTPDQQRKLEAIVDARRQKVGAFRENLRVRFQREATEVGAEIGHILTPDQRKRFDALVSRLQSRYLERSRP